MTGPGAPCRLFVYLAHDAPIGVVLRRGPSDWARLSVWRTDTDIIDHGQWIKGRVYERRSDLSSDGSLFAAFVRQSGRGPSVVTAGSASRDPAHEPRDTWVALSRPPRFTALALWFIGGTYYTGAFFPRRNTLWLGFMEEQRPDIGETPRGLEISPPRDIAYIDGTSNWTERTVHFNRLLRDGWTLVDKQPLDTIWERRHPSRPLTLTMVHTFDDFRAFGGPYSVEYFVRPDAGPEHALGQATWADWDQQGRLVLAQRGKLLSWDEQRGVEVIADFNGQSPDPQPPGSFA